MSAYPPPQQEPQHGQPQYAAAYPPQQAPYPPQDAYPPQGGAAYPPQGGAAYPPQAGAAYPQTTYPPQQPQAATYPPQQPQGYYAPAHEPSKAQYGGVPTQMPPGYDAASAAAAMPNGSAANLVAPPPTESRFAPPSGPQDLWAAVVFLVQLAGFAALAALSISNVDFKTMRRKDAPAPVSTRSATSRSTAQSGPVINFGTSAITATASAAAVAFALSFTYLLLMRKFPKQLIKFTFFLSVAMFFALGAFFMVVGNIIGGIFAILAGGLYLFFYRSYKARMPFASVMLSTVADVTNKHSGTIAVALFGLIVDLAYTVFWVIALISISINFGNFGESSSSSSRGMPPLMYVLWVFSMFSMYFTSQVIQNVVHVTISGVFAAYYFLAGSPQGMPASPAIGAFKRATTTSFGSICFGSLLIAVIQTLRAIARNLRQNSDSIVAVVIGCCLECLLSWIEAVAEYFNHYAFVQVAIYGKPYIRAAKDTWKLIKDRGVDAIINDDLIGNVLGFGSLLVGFITVAVTFGIYAIGKAAGDSTTLPAGNVDITLIIVLVAAFIIGLVMFSLVSTVITSGTATTFVALAEDPAALAASKPELWEKIRETYPEAAFVSMYHR